MRDIQGLAVTASATVLFTVLAFLPAKGYVALFAEGRGAAHGNFSYTLYGLAAGGQAGVQCLVEPQRVFFRLEELAEQIHRVPVDEDAAQTEHHERTQRGVVGHAEDRLGDDAHDGEEGRVPESVEEAAHLPVGARDRVLAREDLGDSRRTIAGRNVRPIGELPEK